MIARVCAAVAVIALCLLPRPSDAQIFASGNSAVCTNFLDFGGNANGVADNGTAWTAAVTAGVSCLYFPSGTYSFSAPISLTMPSSGRGTSITLRGDGDGLTVLLWPISGNGFTLNEPTPNNSFHIRDLAIVTGQTNTSITNSTGLTVNQLQGTITSPASTPNSDITNVSFRGPTPSFDGTHAWDKDVVLNSVSNVSFYNDYFSGNAPYQSTLPTSGGKGVTIIGTSTATSVVFNFTNCTFNANIDDIVVGNFAQGFTISQSNFTGGFGGIQNAIASTSDQILVTGSQFNKGGFAASLNGSVTDFLATSNYIIVPTGANGVIVNTVGAFPRVSIIGNTFFGLTGVVGTGIFDFAGAMVSSGNVFQNLIIGQSLTTGLKSVVTSNIYSGNTTNLSGGAGNFIGTSVTGAPPTVATGAGDCGTSPIVVAGSTDAVGHITVGSSTNGGKCTVSFSKSFSVSPACSAWNETAAARPVYPIGTSISGFAITAGATLTAADALGYRCDGYQ